MKSEYLSRRDLLQSAAELGLLSALTPLLPSYAWGQPKTATLDTNKVKEFDLTIAQTPFQVNGRTGSAVTVNGTVPGPILRFREGQDAIIRVSNTLDETTSIHWHGILLPPEMDGVPGVSFAGIKPGQTFTYKFPLIQSGTYWYHSHSGGQEAQGMYAPFIIDPAKPDPFSYDREYTILLSDWSFMHPMKIIGKLKNDAAYFNFQRRTVGDFIRDSKKAGLSATVKDRLEWMRMRMDATDILDVTGSTYNYLLNGLSPEGNWNGIFQKGERVRLRFIDGAAMTIFDVRIPGAKLTLVQADGQNVQPVAIEEFRISPGETYDVLVEFTEERPYAIFAETTDRSGFAFGTLSPRTGMRAAIPERRKRPLRSMADMGMAHDMGNMKGMGDASDDMKGMTYGGASRKTKATSMSAHEGHQMPASGHEGHNKNAANPPSKESKHDGHGKTKAATSSATAVPRSTPTKHGPDTHGPANAFTPEQTMSRLHEPGTGHEDNPRRVLVYTDLKAIHAFPDQRAPTREVELHLTGNMERFMWSINGKKWSEDPKPILFKSGERLRLTFVNDTMMEHPMHLHGMWMYLENGTGAYLPRKHTILVKPAERLTVAVTVDAPLGDWAFHCHMLFHMEMGMFRVMRVVKELPAVQS